MTNRDVRCMCAEVQFVPFPGDCPVHRPVEAFRAGWDAREEAAGNAQAVKNELDVPDVVHWIEAVTLQPRVSLPACDYDQLRAEVERLKDENMSYRSWAERMRADNAEIAAEVGRLLSQREEAVHQWAADLADKDAEIERLQTLIEKHNDECRECPVIE